MYLIIKVKNLSGTVLNKRTSKIVEMQFLRFFLVFSLSIIMKTIWLLWWISWESSLEYYRIINEWIKEKLWGLNSAKILMYSVNFKEIEELQHKWDWWKLTDIMIKNAMILEKWWADFILICTNTMHQMAEDIEESINIPLLHIADWTALKIKEAWIKKIALLGTRFTMEQDFYKWRLIKNHNIDVIIPNNEEVIEIHRIIYDELCLWKIKDNSRMIYEKIIENLKKRWAEWVILWCTEIGWLIRQKDSVLKVFDTTEIHVKYAVQKSLI